MSRYCRPYINGPMTGVANNNYPRFASILRSLRAAGFDPQSPHLMEANIPTSDKCKLTKPKIYKMVLPGDIYMLSTCDTMISLPDWENSNGTDAELYIGTGCFALPAYNPPTSGFISWNAWVEGAIEWMNNLNRKAIHE